MARAVPSQVTRARQNDDVLKECATVSVSAQRRLRISVWNRCEIMREGTTASLAYHAADAAQRFAETEVVLTL
jgi:hypothetical protein